MYPKNQPWNISSTEKSPWNTSSTGKSPWNTFIQGFLNHGIRHPRGCGCPCMRLVCWHQKLPGILIRFFHTSLSSLISTTCVVNWSLSHSLFTSLQEMTFLHSHPLTSRTCHTPQQRAVDSWWAVWSRTAWMSVPSSMTASSWKTGTWKQWFPQLKANR